VPRGWHIEEKARKGKEENGRLVGKLVRRKRMPVFNVIETKTSASEFKISAESEVLAIQKLEGMGEKERQEVFVRGKLIDRQYTCEEG